MCPGQTGRSDRTGIPTTTVSKTSLGTRVSPCDAAGTGTKIGAGMPSRENYFDRNQSDAHVQVIIPVKETAQVFAVCVWVADALQPGGGPAAADAVTVTF